MNLKIKYEQEKLKNIKNIYIITLKCIYWIVRKVRF